MGSGMHRDFCWHSLECFEKICHSCKLPNFAEMFDAPVSMQMQTPKNVKHRFRLASYPRKPLFVPASQPSTCIHCQSQAMTTPALRGASVRTLDSTATAGQLSKEKQMVPAAARSHLKTAANKLGM